VEQTITSGTNASLTAEVNALKPEVARLKGENVELKRENGTLESTKRKVETLEGKVGVHAMICIARAVDLKMLMRR
jgi:homeobox protein cut-like